MSAPCFDRAPFSAFRRRGAWRAAPARGRGLSPSTTRRSLVALTMHNIPHRRFKGTKIEAYNCGGAYWKATGKTMADRLDKMERFLAECEGDETCHPRYAEF